MRQYDKIEEIETFLIELQKITPQTLEEYKEDFRTKAACERYFEKIVEAVLDLAFLIIKERKLKIPEEDKQVFDILKEAYIISENLSQKLKDAKGMRNIIAHEYGKIDDELVFHSITEEIKRDVEEFIEVFNKSENSRRL